MHKLQVFLSSQAIQKIQALQKGDDSFSDALEVYINKPVMKVVKKSKYKK